MAAKNTNLIRNFARSQEESAGRFRDASIALGTDIDVPASSIALGIDLKVRASIAGGQPYTGKMFNQGHHPGGEYLKNFKS